jgi:hypothetical protein
MLGPLAQAPGNTEDSGHKFKSLDELATNSITDLTADDTTEEDAGYFKSIKKVVSYLDDNDFFAPFKNALKTGDLSPAMKQAIEDNAWEKEQEDFFTLKDYAHTGNAMVPFKQEMVTNDHLFDELQSPTLSSKDMERLRLATGWTDEHINKVRQQKYESSVREATYKDLLRDVELEQSRTSDIYNRAGQISPISKEMAKKAPATKEQWVTGVTKELIGGHTYFQQHSREAKFVENIVSQIQDYGFKWAENQLKTYLRSLGPDL